MENKMKEIIAALKMRNNNKHYASSCVILILALFASPLFNLILRIGTERRKGNNWLGIGFIIFVLHVFHAKIIKSVIN